MNRKLRDCTHIFSHETGDETVSVKLTINYQEKKYLVTPNNDFAGHFVFGGNTIERALIVAKLIQLAIEYAKKELENNRDLKAYYY